MKGSRTGAWIQGAGAVVAGFIVMAGLVIALTWIATGVSGLGPRDDPTPVYLGLNLLGSAVAAVLGGAAAARFGASFVPAAALGLIVLGLSLGSGPAPGQPGWYPTVIAALGVVGVLMGGALVTRRRRRPPAQESERPRDPA